MLYGSGATPVTIAQYKQFIRKTCIPWFYTGLNYEINLHILSGQKPDQDVYGGLDRAVTSNVRSCVSGYYTDTSGSLTLHVYAPPDSTDDRTDLMLTSIISRHLYLGNYCRPPPLVSVRFQ